ncbi:helix-turn-helix transcriptional regulator [Falsiroseomonas sp.]|uniref:helix-turn-helix transcriptional regulator n=1 Tax=Falsiroseomonas sp. TaxID=2870721 RepID=UPI0027360546|nr:helix-turn-helix transcriptional regulator [Falsiroseomonas sp.]MDP3415426.1 helix-turn-helix transcriptional regulator [Falsiroseomonas sp.]
MPLAPAQCRAARGLLDWTQDELADRAGVSRGTVRGFEAGHHELRKSSAAEIRAALEVGGVAFLDAEGGGGPGVRLASPAVGSDARPSGSQGQDDAGDAR